jgi:pimeloyl-ACP methyl ester carboxylesterase
LRGRLEKQLRSASADPAWVDAAAVEGYAAAAFTDLSATLDAARAMAQAVEPEPLRPQLPRVACPVELLLGVAPHEGGVPANELQVLRASLRDLRVVAVPGAGTFIAEERPEAVLLSIRRIHRRAFPEERVVAARGTTSELR